MVVARGDGVSGAKPILASVRGNTASGVKPNSRQRRGNTATQGGSVCRLSQVQNAASSVACALPARRQFVGVLQAARVHAKVLSMQPFYPHASEILVLTETT